MTTPTQVPDELIAGDTWEWERELSDYPASTHSAAWYFEKADHNFSVAAVADGDTFTGTVAAATSAAIRAGKYRWRLVVTRTADSVRKTPEEGWLNVLPDPAAAGNADHRSWAGRVLDALMATYEGRASGDQLSMSLNGRSLSLMSKADLRAEIEVFERRVREEEAKDSGKYSSRQIKVRPLRG